MTKSILIIDDSAAIREQLTRELVETGLFARIVPAADGIEAFKLLCATPFDLILCDLEMPRIDGFKLLTMIAGRQELRDIPVIMLTGHGDRELKIKLLGLGASDYVTKPFDAGELIARVKVQLKIKSLQDELKRSNEMLKKLSNTDPLTQLYNRRYMMTMLEKELLRAERKGRPLSLAMIDIDHFKQVNDRYGHLHGDQVLACVAEFIQHGLRRYDFAARYGGEEFVVTLPETDHNDALVIAERIRSQVQCHQHTGQFGQQQVTVSIGIATYPTAAIASVDALLREADEALYRAKAAGRNRVCSLQQPQAGAAVNPP